MGTMSRSKSRVLVCRRCKNPENLRSGLKHSHEVPTSLVDHKWGQPVILGVLVCLGNNPGRGVRYAAVHEQQLSSAFFTGGLRLEWYQQVQDFAQLHQCVEGLHELLDLNSSSVTHISQLPEILSILTGVVKSHLLIPE